MNASSTGSPPPHSSSLHFRPRAQDQAASRIDDHGVCLLDTFSHRYIAHHDCTVTWLSLHAALRTFYLCCLQPHLLAVIALPLVLVTSLSLRAHPAASPIARWTFPIWLYVSSPASSLRHAAHRAGS